MRQLPLRVRLPDTARFGSFVVGENREVVNLLTAPLSGAPRVIWLWGPVGCGKSHLLQSACAATGEAGGTAAYIDLAADVAPGMLEGCEMLDLVCLDGLERVAGDPQWNAAIFRLHTLMHDGAGRLLVASTDAPAATWFELPDLGSRLHAASIHQLQRLDDNGQIEALKIRAGRRGLELNEEAARFLTHRLPRDMHSLCAVLDRLDEASLAAQRRLTVPFLREALESQLGDSTGAGQ
jgi:DnaA family protein